MVEPEVNQAVQTGHLGGTSDRGSVQGVHINTRRNFGMKPIFTEGQLITRKAQRRKKLWILQTGGFPDRPVASMSS